jgi:hypothetical protein
VTEALENRDHHQGRESSIKKRGHQHLGKKRLPAKMTEPAKEKTQRDKCQRSQKENKVLQSKVNRTNAVKTKEEKEPLVWGL